MSAIETALALRDRGLVNEFSLVLGEPTPGVLRNLASLRDAGIVVHAFPMGRSFGRAGPRWSFSPRLAWWLARNARRYDVVHMHGAWTFTTLFALVCARVTRRVAVLSTHESLTDFDRAKSPRPTRIVKRVLRRFYLATCSLVVFSSALEQRDSGDPDGRRSVVISHAVPPPEHVPTESSRISRSPLAVGFLGRLHSKKNLDVVLESMARLGKTVSLTIAGEGAERDRLHLQARDLGLDRRVAFVGFLQGREKGEFLASIDVLVMPSAYECFGVAAVEALRAGVPALVSPSVGVARFITEHECGFVVEPDAVSITDALARVARDPKLLERMRQTARAAADAEFSREQHGKRLHEQYLRLLRRPLRPIKTRNVVAAR